MMMPRFHQAAVVLAVVLLVSTATTGCFDRIEIDELAFVTSLAIDGPKPQGEQGQKSPAVETDVGNTSLTGEDPRIIMTFETPRPDLVGGKRAGIGPGGAPEKRSVWILQGSGTSMLETLTGASSVSNRVLFMRFATAIFIGEELAREGILPILQFFQRTLLAREAVDVFVVKGRAEEVYSVIPPFTDTLARHMEEAVSRKIRSGAEFRTNLLETAIAFNSNKGDLLLAMAQVMEGGLNLNGAAVLKDGRLVGFLTPEETKGVNWALGQVRAGTLVVPPPSGQQRPTVIDIVISSSKIIASVQMGRPRFTMDVKVRGTVGELPNNGSITSEVIEDLTKRASEQVTQQMERALQKLQTEFKSDALGLGAILRQRQLGFWNQVKGEWNEVYVKDAEFKIVVNIELTTAGLLR